MSAYITASNVWWCLCPSGPVEVHMYARMCMCVCVKECQSGNRKTQGESMRRNAV